MWNYLQSILAITFWVFHLLLVQGFKFATYQVAPWYLFCELLYTVRSNLLGKLVLCPCYVKRQIFKFRGVLHYCFDTL